MKTIPLTRGYTTQVYDVDFEALSKFKWHVRVSRRKLYAVRRESGPRTSVRKFIRMHRQILGALPDEEVDHMDGNGLNNRRDNLRLCSHRQNSMAFRQKAEGATSRFRGVSWHRASKKWRSQISHKGRNVYLGSFSNEVEAAKSYDRAATELFGRFVQLNFPVDNNPVRG